MSDCDRPDDSPSSGDHSPSSGNEHKAPPDLGSGENVSEAPKSRTPSIVEFEPGQFITVGMVGSNLY